MDILNTKIKSILTEKNTKILPSNIKSGVNILGITGTYTGETPTLQSKSITITENGTQTIAADSGYDGLDEVEVTTNVSGGASEYNAKIDTNIVVGSTNLGNRAIDNCIQKLPTSFTLSGTSTDISDLFYEFYALEEIPSIDFSSVTTMQAVFYKCRAITTISLGNTPNLTDIFRCFDGCTNLVSISQFDTSKVTNMRNCYRDCSSLSNDSLNNILAMCAGATRYSGTKTLAYIGLTSAQATTCTGLSNWASAQSAGWSTGY